MSRARCVPLQYPLIASLGVKPKPQRNQASNSNLTEDTLVVQSQLQTRDIVDPLSGSVCDDMYTQVPSMDCERYQDLSQLSWFESPVLPWGAGEATGSAINANDLNGSMRAAFNEDIDYSIMDNQLYHMSRADSLEEIKTLVVTPPMEVIPMRHHEALEISGIVKIEKEEFQVGREEEIPLDNTPVPVFHPFKEDMDQDYLLLDTPDLISELEGRDLIDYITSDEPPQSVVPTYSTLQTPPSTSRNEEPSPPPPPAHSPAPAKTSSKPVRETYLAIPREFTAGTSDDKKIPKMLILKTPQSNLSTINFKDLPSMSIGERIKTTQKRQRTKRYADTTDEEGDDNDNDDADSFMEQLLARPTKRARRTSTTSISSASTDRYRELRDKNNEASRRSRLNRKEREKGLMKTVTDAERLNAKLRSRSDELEKLVLSFRKILLQIVVMKGSQR